MHSYALLPALMALASAIPMPESTVDPAAMTLEKRDSNSFCQDSSFFNKLSPGSPFIEDCKQIAANIKDGGDWNLNCWEGDADKSGRGKWDTIVHFGSCAWGAQCAQAGPWNLKIGNQDIIDLIGSSIEKFGYDNQVGGEGSVDCHNRYLPETQSINWGLYHS